MSPNKQANPSDPDELREQLVSLACQEYRWALWYAGLAVFALPFALLRGDSATIKSFCFSATYSIAVVVAIGRVRDLYRVGPAVFVAVVSWILAAAGLYLAVVRSYHGFAVVNAFLVPSAFAAAGTQLALLARRYQNCLRVAG